MICFPTVVRDTHTFLLKKDFENNTAWKSLREYSQLAKRISIVSKRKEIERKLESHQYIEWHTRSLPNLKQKYRKMKLHDSPVRDPDPVYEFEDTVNWIATELLERNVSLLLLGQPVIWEDNMPAEHVRSLWQTMRSTSGRIKVDPKWLIREMRKYNDKLAEISENYDSAKVQFKDLEPEIR